MRNEGVVLLLVATVATLTYAQPCDVTVTAANHTNWMFYYELLRTSAVADSVFCFDEGGFTDVCNGLSLMDVTNTYKISLRGAGAAVTSLSCNDTTFVTLTDTAHEFAISGLRVDSTNITSMMLASDVSLTLTDVWVISMDGPRTTTAGSGSSLSLYNSFVYYEGHESAIVTTGGSVEFYLSQCQVILTTNNGGCVSVSAAGVVRFDSSFGVVQGSNSPMAGAGGQGGLVYAVASTVEVFNSTLQNSANVDLGGLVHAVLSTVDVSLSEVTSQGTFTTGGVFYVSNTPLTLTNVTAIGSVTTTGSVAYAVDSAVVLTTCDVLNNGGGHAFVLTGSSDLTDTASLFSNNFGTSLAYLSGTGDITLTTTRVSQSSSEWGFVVDGVDGELTATNVVLTDNTAVKGLLSATNGAAVSVDGLDASGNDAGDFGVISALNASSSVSVTSSTFNNNAAPWGGSVYVREGVLTVTGCTFTGGSGENGGSIAAVDAPSVELTGNTFTGCVVGGNGGAVYVTNTPSLTLDGCDFWSNAAGGDGGAVAIFGSTLTLTNAVCNDNSATSEGGVLYASSSVVDMSDCVLTNGSSVAGGGGVFCIAGSDCTVHHSMFEFLMGGMGAGVSGVNSALTVYAVSAFACITSSNGGFLGAQAAVTPNTLNVYNVTVTACEAVSGGAIYSSNMDVSLSDAVLHANTASGDGAAVTVSSGSVSATDLDLRFNSATEGGSSGTGTFYCISAVCNVSDSTLHSNEAGDGGGLGGSGSGCTLHITDVRVESNIASDAGGGVTCTNNAECVFTRVSLLDNSCSDGVNLQGTGGGIYASTNARVSVTDTVLSGNSALAGGGLNCAESVCTLSQSVSITGNFAATRGGGVQVDTGSTLTLTGADVHNNAALGSGGGVNCEDSDAICNISSCVFTYNSANQGGGVYSFDATLEVRGSTFENNTADAVGGAIECVSADCDVVGNTLVRNEAAAGGAVYGMLSGTSLDVSENTIMYNSDGVAVFLTSFVRVADSTLAYNGGSAVSSKQSSLVLSGLVVRGNEANNVLDIDAAVGTVVVNNSYIGGNSGVGLLCGKSTVSIVDSVLCSNAADDLVCNLACSVSGVAGGCDYNSTQCDSACADSGFCVPTRGVFSGPYDGCFACGGPCDQGTDSCVADASCLDAPGFAFDCECNPGYAGDPYTACTNVDECALDTHDCAAQASCTDTVGSFTCACNAGWKGNGRSCTNVNECSEDSDNCYTDPTGPDAACTDTAGSFTCACPADTWGDGVSCTACPNGTYTQTAGTTAVIDCLCEEFKFTAVPGTACGECPPGFRLVNNNQDCVSCPAGQYSNHSGAADCQTCPANTISPTQSDSVLDCVCLPDYYNDQGNAPGIPCKKFCAAGTIRTPGDTCQFCGIGTYSPEPNLEECVDCPANNISPVNSSSIKDCLCDERYFTPERKPGTACLECPEGGLCKGGLSEPIAKPGWGSDGAFGFVECVPAEACKGNGVCKAGYVGVLCGGCDTGYYQLGGRCYPCLRHPEVVVFFCIFALWLLCALLVWFNAQERTVNRFASLVIGVNSLQIAAMYGKLDVDWPALAQSFFDALSIANLNIELMAPECAVTTGNPFMLRWLTTLFMPLLLLFLFGAVYGVAMVWVVITRAADCGRYAPDNTRLRSALTAEPSVASKFLSHTCLRAFYQIMTFAYLPLSATVWEFFDCVKAGKDRYVLSVARDTECYTRSYWYTLPVALMFMLLYPIGMPVFYFVLLRLKRASLGEVKFAIRYGFLVGRFKEEYSNYELVIMGRKFGVVICMAFLTASPYVKAGGAVIVLIAALVVQSRKSPYRIPLYNVVDITCLLCAIVILLLGIMFQDESFGDGGKNVAIVSVILINLSAIAAALVYDFYRLAREDAEAEAEMHANMTVGQMTMKTAPLEDDTGAIPFGVSRESLETGSDGVGVGGAHSTASSNGGHAHHPTANGSYGYGDDDATIGANEVQMDVMTAASGGSVGSGGGGGVSGGGSGAYVSTASSAEEVGSGGYATELNSYPTKKEV